MRRKYARASAAAAVIAGMTAITGCGGGGTTGSPSSDSPIDVSSMENAPKGTITWCAQKDSSGAFAAVVDAFNAQHGAEGYNLKLLEFPESTDEWRNQFVQRQEAKSDECDVFSSDVVWTAEFANKGYLHDLTPYVEKRKDEFIESTFTTTTYGSKNWGVPFGTNVGFLYHRSDKITEAPTSWQDAYADAAATGGVAYQGSAYEGLTVNFLEIATAAGGKVLSTDGKSSAINSPENVSALQFMADGIKNGAARKDVLTYMEEDTRRAFESGNAGLERNWTYAYVLGKKNPAIANSFGISPLPKFEGGTGEGSSILGGINMVISKYSKNPGTALKAVDYITSKEGQVAAAVKGGQPSTLRAAYQDSSVQAALPFWETLQQGIEQATSRPVTPVYSLVSRAIYTNVNKALTGEVSPQDALKQADDEINKALSTF
jgi:multiple sugar transport system substrate-binding protein